MDIAMDNRFWDRLGMADETIAVSTDYLLEYKFGIRLNESEAIALAKELESYLPATSKSSFNDSSD